MKPHGRGLQEVLQPDAMGGHAWNGYRYRTSSSGGAPAPAVAVVAAIAPAVPACMVVSPPAPGVAQRLERADHLAECRGGLLGRNARVLAGVRIAGLPTVRRLDLPDGRAGRYAQDGVEV